MRKQIPEIDLAAMQVAEFQHKEAREILGVSGGCLRKWNERGLVPCSGGDGRGSRRKYSETDLIHAKLFQILVPYVGQYQAAAIAIPATLAVISQWRVAGFAESAEEMESTSTGTFVVIWRKDDGSFGQDVLIIESPDRPFQVKPPEFKTFNELLSGRSVVVVLNVFWITCELFARIEEVRAARKTGNAAR